MALIDKESMTAMVINMHGFKPEDIGTYQEFSDKKEEIKGLLEACDAEHDDKLMREMGALNVILDKRQKLQFYLVEQEDGNFGLPQSMDPYDVYTYETIMLFDELISCLEEIYRASLQKKSSTKLDDSLLALLGLLNEAPYERMSDIVGCLLLLTEK